jgi:hypothetical protein
MNRKQEILNLRKTEIILKLKKLLLRLLTAILLTPGASSPVHIYTKTVHKKTQRKKIHITEHT